MPDGWLVDEESMVTFTLLSNPVPPARVTFTLLSHQIPDPSAEKPDDWEDDTDGEWEPALIDNPVCESAPGCGPWNKPMIDNPL